MGGWRVHGVDVGGVLVRGGVVVWWGRVGRWWHSGVMGSGWVMWWGGWGGGGLGGRWVWGDGLVGCGSGWWRGSERWW